MPRKLRSRSHVVAVSNYHAFISDADALLAVRLEVSFIDKHLTSMIVEIPKLTSGCTEFIDSAEQILEKRKPNQTLLSNHSTLFDFLEIPQLMDTCVRNGNYDEALDLETFVCKLSTIHPKSYAHHPISTYIASPETHIKHSGMPPIRHTRGLPECLRIIGYLRRIGVYSGYEMRLQYCAMGLGWVGLDFRGLLPPLFEAFVCNGLDVREHLLDRIAINLSADIPMSFEDRVATIGIATEFQESSNEVFNMMAEETNYAKTQIILAREYLKDVIISREQLKYLVMEALRGGCQVLYRNLPYFLESHNKRRLLTIRGASSTLESSSPAANNNGAVGIVPKKMLLLVGNTFI